MAAGHFQECHFSFQFLACFFLCDVILTLLRLDIKLAFTIDNSSLLIKTTVF